MKKIFYKTLKAILRLEHIIYCATDCRVEFFLHKSYYRYSAEVYKRHRCGCGQIVEN